MVDLDLSRLSRHPDVEGPELYASDAADRLLLDEAADALAQTAGDAVVVIGDAYGALTLGAAARFGLRGIRVHQDALSGEYALAANAETLGLADAFRSHAMDAALLAGARTVLVRLPRSLDALDEITQAIAAHALPDVQVFAGGMIKHMALAMNDVLRSRFARLDVSHARQKARVLIATGVIPDAATPASRWPVSRRDAQTGLEIVAHGAAFAGATVDIGTRFLLAHLDEAMPDASSAIDLGCGTGVLATSLALRRPGLRVLATDQSAAAVASAAATAEANGVGGRVAVVRDDALASAPGDSAELIVLNPPFHIGATVHPGIALKLFTAAARVLAPGGELWAVWNSHLQYRADLERIVGPTRQIARNSTFTITVSRRP